MIEDEPTETERALFNTGFLLGFLSGVVLAIIALALYNFFR